MKFYQHMTALVSLILAQNVCAQFRTSNVYSNNMVLQMGPKSTQIWGFGSEMFAEIELSFNSQSFYTTVNPNMTWYIQLTPQPAGGPHNITFTQTSIYSGSVTTFQLTNILFGDVWLCVGEGNMEFPIDNIYNSSDELDRLKNYADRIRYARKSGNGYYDFCNENNEADYFWGCNDCGDSIDVKSFSAACLLYGMEMASLKPKRPIGLILATETPSPIETWGSSRVTDRCNSAPLKICDPGDYDVTSLNKNWNNVILPLTYMAIRGVIWNQGESNLGYDHDIYDCHLQAIYDDYRVNFFSGSVPVPKENGIAFPFGIIQLGSMKSGRKDSWGSLRWLQTLRTGILPSDNVPEFFMAVTYDLTDNDSPFGSALPRDKTTAAKRLASAAGALLYNTSSTFFGPYSTTAERGAAGIVGLTFSSKVEIRGTQGFTYRTNEGEWIPAPKFLQISGTKVGVAIPEDATHLAYAWSATVCEYLKCALYSAEEDALPVQPWIWQMNGLYSTTEYYLQEELQENGFPQVYKLD